jgi:hypothetical protein
MKFILALLFSISISCSFGQSMADFFTNKTQVVLLGLDFTQCKFIGKDGFSNPEGLKNHSIPNWNKFFATEPAKYSLQDALGLKDKYYYNSINYFMKRNEDVNTFQNVTDESYTLTKDQIIENVASYTPFEKEGLAISFVVESFNKLEAEAHIWVVYLSLPDNEIIYMEKMVGKPGGAGQVNFWIRAVYDIVSQIEKNVDELKKK